MKTKTDFDFEGFTKKIQKLFVGFEFEEEGHPNDPENPPCFIVGKPGHGCCGFYNPNYNPQCQKPDCIVTLLFNDQQSNLSIDTLLIIPVVLFDDRAFVNTLKQLLRFQIDSRQEGLAKASLKVLIDLISSIESTLNQHNEINVIATIDKNCLNKKELVAYLQ